MEATMFSSWIYDHLKPYAVALTIASTPTRFAAVCAAIFCRSAAWLPPPSASGDATLRYRNLLCQMVQMKIKTSTLLMEAGVSYNKQKLHKGRLFPGIADEQP